MFFFCQTNIEYHVRVCPDGRIIHTISYKEEKNTEKYRKIQKGHI